MTKKRFDKTKLPSRHVSISPERAPHRSYYYAMGMTEEDIAKPFVGVVSTLLPRVDRKFVFFLHP